MKYLGQITIKIFFKHMTVFLLFFYCVGCTTGYSPKKGVMIKVSAGGGNYVVAETKDTLAKFILKCQNYFDKNDFQSIIRCCNAYETKNEMEAPYVENLKAYVYTYEEIDFEKAFYLNNKLFSILKDSNYLDKLVFDRGFEKVTYYNGSTRTTNAFFGAVCSASTVILLPFAIFEKKETTANFLKNSRRYLDFSKNSITGVHKRTKAEIDNTTFTIKFINITLNDIKLQSVNRLIYLNDMIDDPQRVAYWKKNKKQLKLK